MKIVGLNHITINVADLQKSREFYRIVLGLKKAGLLIWEIIR